jgi:hypothetical protein
MKRYLSDADFVISRGGKEKRNPKKGGAGWKKALI